MPITTPRFARTRPLARCLAVAAALMGGLCAAPALAASPTGLWPCIQPRVASLAAAQMWAGPPVDGLDWRADAKVSELVPVLAARRTPLEQADTLIEDFAKTAGPDKNLRLTLLFAGVFDQINGLRSRILTGIERYAKHQIDLSQRIKEESLALAKAKKAAVTDDDKAKTVELEKQVLWDTRIYDTRAQAVTAVCESPVILEQRAFSLARSIQNAMD
ncbi:hypothetical protein AncyloWKF20_02155 [Ancylobacter sp. WKF20]|uniref:hypothetical protein n=1 Tax=Ancylobacter sp. WKF20 TaxID=3039801 RepID=UPI0024343EF4|nr:hypothetical protein [Ancylobacter sp. WKF20]WGD30667.1 hypothetical protein AncyloWKF20_02155 [Ancylobacter sp. WKF20]